MWNNHHENIILVHPRNPESWIPRRYPESWPMPETIVSIHRPFCERHVREQMCSPLLWNVPPFSPILFWVMFQTVPGGQLPEWLFLSLSIRQKSCRLKITLETPFGRLHLGGLHAVSLWAAQPVWPAELEPIAVSSSTRQAAGLCLGPNLYVKDGSLNTRLPLGSVICSHCEKLAGVRLTEGATESRFLLSPPGAWGHRVGRLAWCVSVWSLCPPPVRWVVLNSFEWKHVWCDIPAVAVMWDFFTHVARCSSVRPTVALLVNTYHKSRVGRQGKWTCHLETILE